MPRLSKQETHRRILQFLQEHGGEVTDPKGHVTRKLRQVLDRETIPAQELAELEQQGLITRDIQGRRTYRIATTQGAGNRPTFPEPRPPEGSPVDYGKLAEALLTKVVQARPTTDPLPNPREVQELKQQLDAERQRSAMLQHNVDTLAERVRYLADKGTEMVDLRSHLNPETRQALDKLMKEIPLEYQPTHPSARR